MELLEVFFFGRDFLKNQSSRAVFFVMDSFRFRQFGR